MTTPTRIEDIDEFSLARRIPRNSITPEILGGVRRLGERTEIEPFLRDIIADQTKTPHCASEIVDILTNVNRFGEPVLAGFVNKGRATPKVTSKAIGNQLLRLRQIPQLGLAVLLAVGDLQDDVKCHFIQIAEDAKADYLLVDAADVARLFIAYQKICPKDGFPFQNGRCANCGHVADEPLELTFKVHEPLRYRILSHGDVSGAFIKRYRVEILTDPHYSRSTLREVVKEATWALRQDRYHRTARLQALLGDKEADSVFMFVYIDIADVQLANWILFCPR